LRRLAEGAGVKWYCGIVELRELLKEANHYCHFIDNDYAAVVKPLTVLKSPKAKWSWNNTLEGICFCTPTRSSEQCGRVH